MARKKKTNQLSMMYYDKIITAVDNMTENERKGLAEILDLYKPLEVVSERIAPLLHTLVNITY